VLGLEKGSLAEPAEACDLNSGCDASAVSTRDPSVDAAEVVDGISAADDAGASDAGHERDAFTDSPPDSAVQTLPMDATLDAAMDPDTGTKGGTDSATDSGMVDAAGPGLHGRRHVLRRVHAAEMFRRGNDVDCARHMRDGGALCCEHSIHKLCASRLCGARGSLNR